MNRAATILLLLGACATNEPVGIEFDHSAGLVVVDVAADGFVTCGGRRVPWEALVLELRQRTRVMTGDEMERFVVHLRLPSHPEGSEAAAGVNALRDRLLDQLQIMGVRQAKCL